MAYDKVVDSAKLNAEMLATANAIRTKSGSSASASWQDNTGFASAINSIPSGGGGASNYVKGTFKGTTTGAAMDVNIPYTGNGYPIALLITPTEGPWNAHTGTFHNTLQRYACAMFFVMKDGADAAPSYSGAVGETYTGVSRNKNSATTATTQSNNSINGSMLVCDDTDATGSSSSSIVRIRAKNKISVYIAGTSYGFMANVEYTYHIIYSV